MYSFRCQWQLFFQENLDESKKAAVCNLSKNFAKEMCEPTLQMIGS